MYLGLFLFPWVLMYSVSTLVMNHRAWFVARYGDAPVPFDKERTLVYDGSFPEGADLETLARQILTSVDLDGAVVGCTPCFLGADPATDWLADCGVQLDDKGFVETGAAVHPDRRSGNGEDTPLQLETSVRGIFAIGDVRAGSVKRVGGAIGEGAAVVAQIHGFLAGRT